jgi:hypothetical protein
MPDREFIHATEDVVEVLRAVARIGLIICHDIPSISPRPNVVTVERENAYDRGVFVVFRPDWVFGEFQFQEIPGGYNKGKFSLSPSVNLAPITVYFGGERLDNNAQRLGAGAISWSKSWYRSQDRTTHSSPAEVEVFFRKIIEAIGTGKSLRGGSHNYLLLAYAARKLEQGCALPPFDYIDRHPDKPDKGK